MPTRSLMAALCLVSAVSSDGCMRVDQRILHHQQSLQSLGSSAHAIGAAWLAGHVSATYTTTALQQIFLLIEQERASLAKGPETLIDPRGAQVADSADELARVVAQVIADVRATDAPGARRHLGLLSVYRKRESP